MLQLLEKVKQKALGALQGVGNFIDRDKSMEGVQLAQGGLGNKINNFVAKNNPTSDQNYQGSALQRGIQGFNAGAEKFVQSPIAAPARFLTGNFGKDNSLLQTMLTRPAAEIPLSISELLGGPKTIDTAGPAREFFGPTPLKSYQEQARTGGKDTLVDFGVDPMTADKMIPFMAAAGILADFTPPGMDDVGKGLIKKGAKYSDEVISGVKKAAPSIQDIVAKLSKRVGSVRWDTPAPIEEVTRYLKPAGSQAADLVGDTSGAVSKVKQMSKKATESFFENTPVPHDILPDSGLGLPAPKPQLFLPPPQRNVTIKQLKKLVSQGDNLEGATVLAKNADEARQAIKLGADGNAIKMPEKFVEEGPDLFGANGDILKELPSNQAAFNFAQDAKDATFDTGNKFTRFARKMFLDTSDNLKKTFGTLYDTHLAPVMDRYVTRLDEGQKFVDSYNQRLANLGIQAGSADDKLIRLFGKKDGYAKVAAQVGDESALRLQKAYDEIRQSYDEIIDFINVRRAESGLSQIPKKEDFLSQVGSGKKGIFDFGIEGAPYTVDERSSAIFKKQDGKATTGAIESMTKYLDYAKRAAFSDLTGKEIADFRTMLSTNKGVPREALEQLNTIEKNILGNKQVNPVLQTFEKITAPLRSAAVLGKVSSVANQGLSLPQAIANTGPINFIKGQFSKEARMMKEQSRFLKTVSPKVPDILKSGNAYTKTVDKMGGILMDAQNITSGSIWQGFYQKARQMGMEAAEAVKWADTELPKIVADRRLAMAPEIYNTWVGKVFGAFTLEPTAATAKLMSNIGEKKFAALIGTLTAWHFTNVINKEYGTGYSPFPDPYQAVMDSAEFTTGSDRKEQDNIKAFTVLFSEALQAVPIANSMFNTAYSAGEGLDVLPPSEEVMGNDQTWMNVGSLYSPFSKIDRTITGNKPVDVAWNLGAKVVPGLEQAAKTTQAANTLNRGYAVTKDGSPMYEAPDSLLEKGRALTFGQNATKNAQEFFNNDNVGWLTDNQKKAFDRITDKEGKLAFLQTAQSQNEGVNKMRSSTAAKELSFFDKLLGNKETTPTGAAGDLLKPPTSSAESKENKTIITEMLDNKQVPSKNDLSIGLFDQKTANTKVMKDKVAVFKDLKSAMDNEMYSNEQKKAILDASGASADQYDYYNKASQPEDVKIQELIGEMGDMSNKENFAKLMLMRASVAGNERLPSGVITYLYERDHISKEQKELLSGLKFDENTGEFYFTKGYQKANGFGGGSGSSGGKKLTYNQALELYSMAIPKLDMSKLYKPMTSSSSARDERLITSILSGPK